MSESHIKISLGIGESRYSIHDHKFETCIELPFDSTTEEGLRNVIHAARGIVPGAVNALMNSIDSSDAMEMLNEKEESKKVQEANSKRWAAEREAEKEKKAADEIKATAACFVDSLSANGLAVPQHILEKLGIEAESEES